MSLAQATRTTQLTCENKTLKAQLAHTATAVPIDRVLVGNTCVTVTTSVHSHGPDCTHLGCQHPTDRAETQREEDTREVNHCDAGALCRVVIRRSRREACHYCRQNRICYDKTACAQQERFLPSDIVEYARNESAE